MVASSSSRSPLSPGTCGPYPRHRPVPQRGGRDAHQERSAALLIKTNVAGDTGREERNAVIHRTKSAWLQALSGMDHEDDDPGTVWNAEARKRDADRMSPR